MYNDFQRIAKDSHIAYEYAETHFEELMQRNVSHILYGPPSYGPGAVYPSRRMIKDKDRILKPKTKRKEYKAYYFDKNWDLLFSREYGKQGLCCTMVHFWIGNINYARYFLRDTNDFYISTVFSVEYEESKPIRCAFASSSRVYVEYYYHKNDGLTEYRWYDYYPHRKFSEDGTPLTTDAPLGTYNSPVTCGTGFFELPVAVIPFNGAL